MKTRKLTILAALVMVVATVVPAGAASAAPPPAGYPTDQIMATAQNASLGPIPIHRGFWDAAPDQGFGMDKAWNKHNIWSVEAMRRVLLSPNYTMQANGNYALVAYAGKYSCSSSSSLCVLEDERKLVGVHDGRTYANYYGWPVNGLMGMLTLYCDQGGA